LIMELKWPKSRRFVKGRSPFRAMVRPIMRLNDTHQAIDLEGELQVLVGREETRLGLRRTELTYGTGVRKDLAMAVTLCRNAHEKRNALVTSKGQICRSHNMAVRGSWKVAVALMAAGLLGACGNSGENATAATKPKVEVYEMRGVIEKLPAQDAPRKVTIRHEATKEMGVMTMGFALAEGVSLTGLAVGDKVAFRYEVNLTAGTEWVTKMEKLPADTSLNLGATSMPGMMTMPGM
jgi:Cu/Ag efflux protein CusF